VGISPGDRPEEGRKKEKKGKEKENEPMLNGGVSINNKRYPRFAIFSSIADIDTSKWLKNND
jgi:hypothetical protein